MTDHDSMALARRLVACSKFYWLPGMRLQGRDDMRVRVVDADWWNVNRAEFAHLLPDLTDAATLGCLLQLVREAWARRWAGRPGVHFPAIYIERVSGGWRHRLVSCCEDADGRDSVAVCDIGRCFETEAEALVAALLAAPE